MISQEDAEIAINLLSDTDLESAQLKRAMLAHEYIMKRVRAHGFLAATGNVEERKSQAEASEDYGQASEKYLDAVEAYEYMRNKRATAEIQYEAWRSINANRRQGG